MNMDMKEVTSSQIHSVGYDASTKTLAIRFKGKNGPGSVYHYENVEPADHAALVGAESIGAHFGKHIKPHTNKFPFRKQEPHHDAQK